VQTGKEQAVKKDTIQYPDHVGDIAYDAKADDASFRVCSQEFIAQYYSFGGEVYIGEKPAIVSFFRQHYKGEGLSKENGYVTIRFIVNCEGKSGRFRVREMDFDYQPKQFNKQLISQLVVLTKRLDGWQPAQNEGKFYDYYYYLTFKIVEGQIQTILP
jgi:hypothetical protein